MPMLVYDITSLVTLAGMILLFVLEAWAVVDSLAHRPEEYEAAGKQTKKMWVLILGISLAAFVITLPVMGLLNIFNMAGAVASIVYLVDVRPAIRSLTRR